jgi:hypothetical protein
MVSAKSWYFAALGVVALSFGSSSGRCVFDQASRAVDQFRAKTMPYVAMLEMTLGHPQNSPQVQATAARIQGTVAEVEAQRACAQASMARVQAMKDRLAARRAAMQDQVVEDEDFAVGDDAWSKLATVPENIVDTRKVVIANHALARVKAWKESGNFIAPHVKFTPNQIVIESPQGIVVAPRGNGASFPARAMERMEDPI